MYCAKQLISTALLPITSNISSSLTPPFANQFSLRILYAIASNLRGGFVTASTTFPLLLYEVRSFELRGGAFGLEMLAFQSLELEKSRKNCHANARGW